MLALAVMLFWSICGKRRYCNVTDNMIPWDKRTDVRGTNVPAKWGMSHEVFVNGIVLYGGIAFRVDKEG